MRIIIKLLQHIIDLVINKIIIKKLNDYDLRQVECELSYGRNLNSDFKIDLISDLHSFSNKTYNS